MSGVVSRQFGLMVPHGKLEQCIAYLEDGLRSLKPTPYHVVLGRTFLHEREELAEWIENFAKKADSANVGLQAIYLEMNGFAINPNEWHCNIFGYKKAGDIWDLEWLSSWDAEQRERFVLTGMEGVQKAYSELPMSGDQPLGVRLAEEVAEHLVTARFMEVVAAAHHIAKGRFHGLDGMPILATAHNWDRVHRSV